jgi:two-component system OmpR family response regulator
MTLAMGTAAPTISAATTRGADDDQRTMRILIVEDGARFAALLRRSLEEEGYACDVALTGEDAVLMASATDYDVITLDVMLPRMDGFQALARLREAEVWSPVLMLTARDALRDRVTGLDSGADDYLTKPFALEELLARIRALARRGPIARPAVLQVGSLRLDPGTHGVWRHESQIDLTAKEFALLHTFMSRPGQVLSRFDLLEHAWDYGYENRSNVIDVYVRHLRDKIDRPFGTESIETLRGVGYRLRAEETPSEDT